MARSTGGPASGAPTSGGRKGLCVAANALHHGEEPIRALWCQMFPKAKFGEGRRSVEAQDLLWALVRIHGKQDSDEAAHDVGVAIAHKRENRHSGGAGTSYAACEPELAGTAAPFFCLPPHPLPARGRRPPPPLPLTVTGLPTPPPGGKPTAP